MIHDNISKKEIEAKIADVGDYVKMDLLQQCLKKNLDFDTRKFVLTKLSSIYESRMMYLEAGKLIKISADINTTYDAKVNEFVKSAELFIKGGNYDEADIALTKAFGSASVKQKAIIKQKVKIAYKNQAIELMKKDKRKNAADVFEKLLTLPYLDSNEKKDAQNALLQLYQKLGKIREIYALQKNMANPQPIPAPKFEENGREEREFRADDMFR